MFVSKPFTKRKSNLASNIHPTTSLRKPSSSPSALDHRSRLRDFSVPRYGSDCRLATDSDSEAEIELSSAQFSSLETELSLSLRLEQSSGIRGTSRPSLSRSSLSFMRRILIRSPAQSSSHLIMKGLGDLGGAMMGTGGIFGDCSEGARTAGVRKRGFLFARK